jgi:hypothetical protein
MVREVWQENDNQEENEVPLIFVTVKNRVV